MLAPVALVGIIDAGVRRPVTLFRVYGGVAVAVAVALVWATWDANRSDEAALQEAIDYDVNLAVVSRASGESLLTEVEMFWQQTGLTARYGGFLEGVGDGYQVGAGMAFDDPVLRIGGSTDCFHP